MVKPSVFTSFITTREWKSLCMINLSTIKNRTQKTQIPFMYEFITEFRKYIIAVTPSLQKKTPKN